MKSVLFTQRVEIIEAYNERRDCADQRIANFIYTCGYLPVPLSTNAEIAIKAVQEIKPLGIILTGGNSLVKYGGDAPERDETDKALIELAINRNIPLYGFCRGMQSILDYFGNELVNVQGHVAVRHKIIGMESDMDVNSYHHQGCVELTSSELIAVMKSDDEVIEKIKHSRFSIIGTMWHPERENPFMKHDIDMVKELMG